MAGITGTVAPIACAAQVALRPSIGAVEASAAPAPVAGREPGNTLAALRRQAVTWDGRRRGYREYIAAPQTEQVSRRDCQCEAL